MNKKLRLLVILVSLPLLIAATQKANFAVSGVKGKLLTNIKSRLTELAQNKNLERQSDEELRLQVKQAMQPYGYFKPQISISRHPLRFNIIPGPQMPVHSLTVEIIGEGANNEEIKKTLKTLALQEGKPFNSTHYEDSKQSLLNSAEHQGYLRSSFERSEILIDTRKYSATIILIFNTGPQYYFGQVQFDPTYISPQLLYRYIPFQYGQPYSTDQILTFNSQLSGSGYFKNVTVKPKVGEERYIPIDVNLQRASRINYSVGLGFGTDTGVRGRAGVHVVPVNRAGHKFNLVALGSLKENVLQGQYLIPGRNPVTDQYTITGNTGTRDYSSGYSNSFLLSLAQQHKRSDFQRTLSLNGLYERYNYYLQPREEKLTLYPKASFTWLKVSDKLFSPNGYNITVNALGASKAALSQENFLQASMNAKAALTIPSWRTRFYLHGIQGFTAINDINQLPLSLALLLGGADNLKAYSFNSIGPGKVLSYAGLEIQKETYEHWYLTAFFDSGDVYKPRRKNLQHDVGIGLMWVSPVGPIKVGVAQALDTHFHQTGKRPKLVISMGPDL